MQITTVKMEIVLSNAYEPAIGGYNPVSFVEAQSELGWTEFHADHDNEHYLFTSAAQVSSFLENQGKYVSGFR